MQADSNDWKILWWLKNIVNENGNENENENGNEKWKWEMEIFNFIYWE